MKNKFSRLRSGIKKVSGYLGQLTEWTDSDDQLIIMPYRGYANSKRFFLKGRVLENEGLFEGKTESEIRNIIDTLKRFETDELPDAKVLLKIGEQQFEATTDEEGYFVFDEAWDIPITENLSWIEAELSLPNYKNHENEPIRATGMISLPGSNVEYGVITDVDDTVLQTHVTSRFRLKMLYATFMQNADQRLPMEGVVELFKSFVKGKNKQRTNPIFYVSSSPWNLYDLLTEFMDLKELPKGPVMLRDYGIRPSGSFSTHKIDTISHILKTYPDLPFIMLGDTAHRDADFYIELAQKFPNQIKAVYIRQTRDTKNARRIVKLIEAQTHVDAVLIHSSDEITAHAKAIGLLNND